MAPKAVRRQGSLNAFDKFRVSKPPVSSSKLAKNIKPVPAQSSNDVQTAELTSSDVPIPLLEHSDSSSSLTSTEPVVNKIVRPSLNESDSAYTKLAGEIQALRRAPQIHQKTSTIETILRDFDLTGKYGPCVGITRLERFHRAQKWGLNPPKEIGMILETQEAEDRTDYKHEMFYGRL